MFDAISARRTDLLRAVKNIVEDEFGASNRDRIYNRLYEEHAVLCDGHKKVRLGCSSM